MAIYLVSSDDLPEELNVLWGKSRRLVKRGTALDVAKALLREGGGSTKPDEIWRIDKASAAEDDAVNELAERVREQIRTSGQLALRLSELSIPIHALFEIARATSTVVLLAAVFEPDPDSTMHDE